MNVILHGPSDDTRTGNGFDEVNEGANAELDPVKDEQGETPLLMCVVVMARPRLGRGFACERKGGDDEGPGWNSIDRWGEKQKVAWCVWGRTYKQWFVRTNGRGTICW